MGWPMIFEILESLAVIQSRKDSNIKKIGFWWSKNNEQKNVCQFKNMFRIRIFIIWRHRSIVVQDITLHFSPSLSSADTPWNISRVRQTSGLDSRWRQFGFSSPDQRDLNWIIKRWKYRQSSIPVVMDSTFYRAYL